MSWPEGVAASAESPLGALLLAGMASLTKLVGSSKKPLYKLIRTECQNITQHIMEQNKKNQELMRSGSAGLVVLDTDADKYFLVLKLACETGVSKVMCVALDIIQKLVAHGFLHGNSTLDPRIYADPNPHRAKRQQGQGQGQAQAPTSAPPTPAKPAPAEQGSGALRLPEPPAELAASSPANGGGTHRRSASDSPPAPATLAAGGSDGKLISVLIDTLYHASQYKDAHVHLLILKCILTCLTSSNVGVHGWSLLQAVSTCYQIYLSNPSSSNSAEQEVNRVTAKATLTQIVNLVFQRMEHFSAQLRQIQRAQEVLQQQQQQQMERHKEPPTPVAPASSATPDLSASPMGSPSPDSATTPSLASAALAGYSVGSPSSPSPPSSAAPPAPGRHGFCTWCARPAGHYCLQTKESVCSMECKLANLRARDPDDELTTALKRKVRCQVELCQNDAYYLLRALCKLSIKILPATGPNGEKDPANAVAVESKILSLQLLLSILTNAGVTFRTGKHFVATVKGDLVNCLLRNSAASSIETIFALSSSLFVALVCHFKPHLHAVLGPVLGSIYLPYIASPNSTFEHKYISLTVLHKLCSDPQTLLELFVNYDCDPGSLGNTFQMMANTLERVCRSKHSGNDNWLSALEEGRLRLLSLEALVDTIKSLLAWTKHAQAKLQANKEAAAAQAAQEAAAQAGEGAGGDGYDSDEEHHHHHHLQRLNPHLASARTLASSTSTPHLPLATPGGSGTSSDAMQQFQLLRAQRQKLDTGILKFNMKPKKGLAYLASHGLLDATSAAAVAEFFIANTQALDKVQVGEFMGDENEFHKAVLYAYVDRLNFQGLGFQQAIRKFLQGFWLPGEAQKIDRMMEKFAEQYHRHNPGIFSSADTAYVLAYSVIMLNVDAHSPMVKARMSKEEFFRNTRGIDDGKDIDPQFLSEIYEGIVHNEIKMKDDRAEAGAHKKSGGVLLGLSNSAKRGDRLASFISESEGLVAKVGSYLDSYTKKHEAELRAQESGGSSASTDAAAAAGGADPATRRRQSLEMDEAKSFYVCTEADLDAVRPMFEILWYPSLATFSVLLEEADTKGADDLASSGSSGAQPGGGGHGSYGMRTVELCLEGYRNSIRLSSALQLETSRLAFVTSLRKFTLLGSTKEMSLKNIEAIKMLLHISHTEGNSLAESWLDVLTCISELERLHLFATGSRPIADVFQSTPLRTRESDSVNSVHVTRIDASSIDRVFTSSAHLDSEAIVHFVKALRMVSEQELASINAPRVFSLQKIVEITYYNMGRIRVVWSRIWSVLSAYFMKAGTHPNLNVSMYAIDSLRQLAMKFLEKDELANYQFQKHFFRPFELIMLHNSSHGTRELIVECMNKMVQSRVHNIKSGWRGVFVVIQVGASQSYQPLVASSFALLSLCVDKHFDLLTSTTDTIDALTNCLVAFGCNSFTEVSLKSLHYLNQCADHLGAQQLARREKLAQRQMQQQAAAQEGGAEPAAAAAAAAAIDPESRSRNGSTDPSSSLTLSVSQPSSPLASAVPGGLNVDASDADLEMQLGLLSPTSSGGSNPNMQQELKIWFLALTGLSRMVGDPRLEVRTRALATLFNILHKHGNLFSQSTWRAVFHGVLFPIFDDVRHVADPAARAAAQGQGQRKMSRSGSGDFTSPQSKSESSAHHGAWSGAAHTPSAWRNVNNWAWPASGLPKQHFKPITTAQTAATAQVPLSPHPVPAVNGIGVATTGVSAAAALPSAVVHTPRSIPALPPKPPTMPGGARLPTMPPPTAPGSASRPPTRPAAPPAPPSVDSSWLSTTCLSALSTLVELFEHFYSSVSFLLSDLLQLIHSCIASDSEDLARIGVKSMVMLIVKCGPKLSPSAWWVALESCAEIVQRTMPTELLSHKLRTALGMADDAGDAGDEGRSSGNSSRAGSRRGSSASAPPEGSHDAPSATPQTAPASTAPERKATDPSNDPTSTPSSHLSVNVSAPSNTAAASSTTSSTSTPTPTPVPLAAPTPSTPGVFIPPSPGTRSYLATPSPSSAAYASPSPVPPSLSSSSHAAASPAAPPPVLPFSSAVMVNKFRVQFWLLDAIFQIVDAFFPKKSIELQRMSAKGAAAAGAASSSEEQSSRQPEASAGEEGQDLDFFVQDASSPNDSPRPSAAAAGVEEAPLGALTCEQLFFALDLLSSSLNFSRAFNGHVQLRRRLYAAGFITEHTLQGRLPQLFLQETRATRLLVHLLFRLIREGSEGESLEAERDASIDGQGWLKHQAEQQASGALDEDLAAGSSSANGGATPLQATYARYVHLAELRLLSLSLRFLHDYASKCVSGQLVSLEFSEELLCSFVENVARLAQASPARFQNYLSVWFHPLVQLVAFATPPIRAHLALLFQHALPNVMPITPVVPFALQKIIAPIILVPGAPVPQQQGHAPTAPQGTASNHE